MSLSLARSKDCGLGVAERTNRRKNVSSPHMFGNRVTDVLGLCMAGIIVLHLLQPIIFCEHCHGTGTIQTVSRKQLKLDRHLERREGEELDGFCLLDRVSTAVKEIPPSEKGEDVKESQNIDTIQCKNSSSNPLLKPGTTLSKA